MKILRVIASMNPKSGGPCQGIRNANSHLQKLGIEVEVVCMDDINDIYGVEDNFIIYKMGKGKTSYQYQPLFYKWFKENAIKYDCVIVHGLWQYHNLAVYKGINAIKKTKKNAPKVIVMPHGMLDPYFQKAPERKIKALRNKIIWHLIEKKCINQADALFYTCQQEMNLAVTTFWGYSPKRTINVGYGIDSPPNNKLLFSDDFYKICPALEGKKYWLFLSRIHHKKGVDLLVKAYSELLNENHLLPELVIAGPTESNFAQEVIQLAKDNSKIHFPGMLQGSAKWGAFYECELYILPSHQENFGIAIVEAMACKKPVLITKNVNIWQEISEEKGGWVLEELTSDSIKKEFINISKYSEKSIQIMGRNAFSTYENKFKADQCASQFSNALQSL